MDEMSDDERAQTEKDVKQVEKRMTAFLSHFGVPLEGEEAQAEVNHVILIAYAAERSMLDIVQESGVPTDYEELLAQVRHGLLLHLWLHNRLDTPWMLLVDREFPGKSLEQADFESFAREAGDEILDALQVHQNHGALHMELMQFLEDHDYDVAEGDALVAAVIASNIGITRTQQTGNDPNGRKYVAEARQQSVEIIAEASDPEHHAWKALLDHYLPEQ